MKSIIKYLFFDNEVVESIKRNKTEKNHLYNLLNSGRITLKEYLEATAA